MTRKRAKKLIMAVSAAKRNGANFIMNHKKNRTIPNAQVVASIIDFLAIHNALPFNVCETIKGDWKKYSIAYEAYRRQKKRSEIEQERKQKNDKL